MTIVVKVALGIAVGAAAGYGLSRLLCLRGTCPITSNRPLMMAVGGLLGLWLAVGGCSRARTAPSVSGGLTTSEEFEAKVLKSPRPVLVDFTADWCGPCQQLAPILSDLEHDYEGRIDFYRVDVDVATELAGDHRISGIPTLEFYRDGQRVDRVVGFIPKDKLKAKLDALLPAPAP